jgi:16S rRNA processing protein RimM
MADGRLVVIGRALKPFGVKGELKVFPYTESSYAFERSSFLTFEDVSYRVRNVRSHRGTVVVSLEGIDSPEAAAELRGRLVRTAESNLPPKEENEYYWLELIGMKVRTLDGLDLGAVTEIIATGANDVLCVQGPRGEVLLPMIDEVIVDVDAQDGIIVVDPLEGLIPDA